MIDYDDDDDDDDTIVVVVVVSISERLGRNSAFGGLSSMTQAV